MTTEMMMMMTLMFVEKKSMMMRRMMKIIIIPVLVVLLLHLPALPFEVEVNHGPRPGSRPKGQSCTRFYRVLFGCYYRFPWV